MVLSYFADIIRDPNTMFVQPHLNPSGLIIKLNSSLHVDIHILISTFPVGRFYYKLLFVYSNLQVFELFP